MFILCTYFIVMIIGIIIVRVDCRKKKISLEQDITFTFVALVLNVAFCNVTIWSIDLKMGDI